MFNAQFLRLASSKLNAKRLPTTFTGLAPHASHQSTHLYTWDDVFLAMAKTMVMQRRVPRHEIAIEARGLSYMYQRHFTPGSFLLRPGRASYYKDAERSSFSGRFGEALGYLFATDVLGFNVAHYANSASIVRLRRPTSRQLRRPDYILRNGRALSLGEFKGTVVRGGPARVRGALREGMKQCRSIARRTTAPIVSSHAILTVIHEAPSAEPSFTCEADPPEERAEEFDNDAWADAATRIEVGAALALAGFEELALELWENREGDTTTLELQKEVRTVPIAGRKFVAASDDELDAVFHSRILVHESLVWAALNFVRGQTRHLVIDRFPRVHIEDVTAAPDGTAVVPGGRFFQEPRGRLG